MLMFLFLAGFLSGMVDAIAGGGGLISFPALMLTGLPMPIVLGTGKFQSTIGTSIATAHYYRSGLINLNTVYRGLIFGFIGCICGVVLVHNISNQFMTHVAPILMIFVFCFNLFYKSLGVTAGKARMSEQIFFAIFGFIFGFYDAFFGPGVGNFWIIAIVFFLGYNFLNASGYAKMLNLKSNIFALAFFLYYKDVNFTFGITMAIGSILGSYFGAKIVITNGSKLIRKVFLVVVACSILSMFFGFIT
jgi:cupin 2 domain-containing protein